MQNLLDNKGLLTEEGIFIAEIPDSGSKIKEFNVVAELAEILQ